MMGGKAILANLSLGFGQHCKHEIICLSYISYWQPSMALLKLMESGKPAKITFCCQLSRVRMGLEGVPEVLASSAGLEGHP